MQRPLQEPRFAPRIEAGWLFLSAGLVLVASVALMGPLDDLARIRYRRDRLAALERASTEQLEAYLVFLEALEDEDPVLLTRLVAAQMNRIPESVEPIGMIGTELDAHVDHWIQSSLPGVRPVPSPAERQSWLRRLSTGEYRVWTLMAGAVMVFVGLLPRSKGHSEEDKQIDEDHAPGDCPAWRGNEQHDNSGPAIHMASIGPGQAE